MLKEESRWTDKANPFLKYVYLYKNTFCSQELFLLLWYTWLKLQERILQHTLRNPTDRAESRTFVLSLTPYTQMTSWAFRIFLLLPSPPDSVSNNHVDQWDALRNILIKVVRSRCYDSREGGTALRYGGVHTSYNIHTIYHCVWQVKMSCFLSCFQIIMEKEKKKNKTKQNILLARLLTVR